MHFRIGALPALLALALTATPAHAQAQDQEARSAIQMLKAEIQKLQSEVAALQARVNRHDQVLPQSSAGVQIGNADTMRLAIVTTTGSILFDRDTVTINARKLFINGDRTDINDRDTVTIKSDTINLDARVANVKGDSSAVIKGAKVLGN